MLLLELFKKRLHAAIIGFLALQVATYEGTAVETFQHTHRAHGTAHIPRAAYTTAKGCRQTQRLLFPYSIEVRARCKHGLRTIETGTMEFAGTKRALLNFS